MSLQFSNHVELWLPESWEGHLWMHRNAGQVLRPHRHDELEFNFVARGRAAYLLQGRTYEMRRGSLAWLFPKQDHVLLHQSPDLELWILVVRPRLVQRLCREDASRTLGEPDPPGEFCRRLGEDAGARLLALCQEVGGRPPETDLHQAGVGYALMAAWDAYRAAADDAPGRPVHPAVTRAISWIREGGEPESLAEMARALGLSPTRLGAVFRRQTGMTLVAFRTRQRLERFLRLRERRPDRAMAALALDAGFGSYAQFYRAYRDAFGRSPRFDTDRANPV